MIFAETREEWIIAAHGLFKQNITLATSYATLGEEAIAHSINETEVTVIVTSTGLLSKLKSILKKTPMVQTIIYMEEPLTQVNNLDDIAGNIMFLTYDDVLQKGAHSNDVGTFEHNLSISQIITFDSSLG